MTMHVDARGWLCEIARASEVGQIAQVYVTACYPGVIKGWHRHRFQTDRLFCVSGMARIVTAREETKRAPEWFSEVPQEYTSFEIREKVIGPLAPKLIVIPPGVWHAFTPAGPEPCLIINCPNREYDGTDEERLKLWEIPHDWEKVSR